MVMEAGSCRLKLGVGMDTVVFLSPLRHPSSPSGCKLGVVSSISRSAAAANNPRRFKQQRSMVVGNTNTNSSSSSPTTRPATRPWPSRLRSPSASASTATTTPPAAEPQKEKDLVFVAGATGRVGSRAVRELIKLGFRVRAAVRNAQRASSLLQSVQQLKLDGDAASAISPADKLEIVECDLEKQPQEGLVAAIGNASLVVCSIGASEKEILDVTGPYRIDYMATNNLVQAAAAAKVEHFILVTSLGTNRIGFPAFLLNLFWGVLCWKRRAEETLIASGIPYTIIRPGGMERPTDAFKETHNLVVAAEDTYVGGQVSNLQVAELIGCVANNRSAAYCKVVEVIAETTAPLLPMEQLLSTVPSQREPPPVSATTEEVKSSEPKQPSAAGPPPTPTAQGGEAAKAAARPLSPYTAYEGLKPPSSPSPTPSSSEAVSNNKKPQEEAAAAASSLVPTSGRPLSPYTAFVDLKPPSSPSPPPPPPSLGTADDGGSASATASSSSHLDSSNDNGIPCSSDALEQLQGENQKQQQRPLSPYTWYEDLKPPSSPTPSAPKT